MLTMLFILLAVLIAFGLYVDRRADLREAAAEARFPAEGKLLKIGDRTVHVVVRGEGPDLVLLHGAGGNSREVFSTLGEHLDGFRVIVFDRLGLGWSETAFDSAFSRAAESPAEQAAILAAAAEEVGVTDPIVVGHSFGGAVAMAWALDHPASAVVILSGATMPWDGDVNITYRVLGTRLGGFFLAPLASAFIGESYIETTLKNVFAPQPVPENYATRAAIPLTLRTSSIRANNRQVNTLRPHIVEQAERYPSLSLPVEIIHGREDPVTPLHTHAIPLSETVPEANLVILEGIGHMPHHVVPHEARAAIDRAVARAGLSERN